MRFASAIATVALSCGLFARADADADWSRIYLGSCPSVSPDGSEFFFEWNDSIWTAPTAGGVASRLTPEDSNEGWPLVSPDGKRVAFLSSRDGGFKVFTLDRASGEVKQVTRHSEMTRICAWAPDGVSLVGTVARDAAPTDRCIRAALFSPDGAETILMDDVQVREAALSPDGRLLAFSRRGEDIYRKRRSGPAPQDAEIWLFDTATREFTRPATTSESAFSPCWRPDGKAFYYLGRAKGATVAGVREYVIASGADREVVSFGDDAAFQPSVSADGRTMVVRAGFDFWRFDPTAAAPSPERIVMHPGSHQPKASGKRRRYYDKSWNHDGGGGVTFCSDGLEVAFTAGGGLYAMDTVVRNPRLVHDEPKSRVVECVFAPDGSRLFCLVDFGDATAIRVIERADPSLPWWENAAFSVSTIVEDEEVRSRFSISPDGSRLAWSDPLGNMTFAGTDGGVVGRGPAAAGLGSYSWSPDGRWVAAALLDGENNYDIWLVPTDPEAGEPYNLSRNWKWDGTPAWSPDGKIVAWSGNRPDSSHDEIFYVYLDPKDEKADADAALLKSRRDIVGAAATAAAPETAAKDSDAEKEVADAGDAAKSADASDAATNAEKRVNIVFDGLFRRIRRAGVAGVSPFFSHDSRTLAFDAGAGTDTIHIPDRMNAVRLTDRRGRNAVWYAKDDRLAWVVGDLPAHFNNAFGVKVYRTDDLADYREIVYRTAWARIRDKFCDRGFHGADWPAVRDRYLPAARNAPSHSVFNRVMNLTLGELDASHLGFYQSAASEREWSASPRLHGWSAVTGHLGVAFEKGTNVVASVVRGSPADGVLVPGDEITAIDGRPLSDGAAAPDMLLAPEGRSVRLTIAGRESEPVHLRTSTYAAIRGLIETNEVEDTRRAVAEKSGGRIGYLAVRQMELRNYQKFEDEVYSECWDKDALIIDLRGNLGGFVADRLLSVLCGSDHSRAVTPNGLGGYLFCYWTRPVFPKPIAVIVDERVQSNGEIFSHAIKTLKRGVIVGRRTSGSVIATIDSPLLDYGMFRDAFWGWFLKDGADMENNGVVPDVPVDVTPADEAAGRDPQLDAAFDALSATLRLDPPAPFIPRYAK